MMMMMKPGDEGGAHPKLEVLEQLLREDESQSFEDLRRQHQQLRM